LARADNSPDAALARILGDAHAAAAAPNTCAQPGIDRLVRVLCTGLIRVGVRDDYPLFSTPNGQTRQGYEVDIGRAIASKLGVDLAFTNGCRSTGWVLGSWLRLDLALGRLSESLATRHAIHSSERKISDDGELNTPPPR